MSWGQSRYLSCFVVLIIGEECAAYTLAYTVQVYKENKKFCELKKREYRDGVKRKETR